MSLTPYLEQFAHLAQASLAYQGHGWGIAYRLDGDRWAYYKNITPIWKDDLRQFPPADMALVHARSAFGDEGIIVENNSPFTMTRQFLCSMAISRVSVSTSRDASGLKRSFASSSACIVAMRAPRYNKALP
jgi:predicted glutamine amidotransferase